MKKQYFALIVSTILILSASSRSQTVIHTTDMMKFVEKSADVNFMEIARQERLHPKPLVRKKMFDESGEEERPEQEPVTDQALIHMYSRDVISYTNSGNQRSILPLGPHSAYYPISPTPVDTFQAKLTDGTSIPPDTHGDVDSTYAVTAINTSVTIQLKSTHAVVSSVTLDAFWASMESHGTGAYDPRVHYDHIYHRWVMVCDCYGESANSQIMIAVSATGNPTGTWHMYKLVVGTASNWLDFPNVGINKRWIVVTGNFFTMAGSFVSDVMYVFDYATMRAGGTMSYATLTPPSGSFTIAPAITYDTAEANMFCMENYNGGAGQLRLFKITGAIGAGLALSSVGFPATATHWQGSAPGGGADFAPQLGSTYKLQTNDDRIHNLKQRYGKLYCAYTAHLPATGTATRASAMWWETDTLGAPVQVGLIDDPTAAHFYFFPSIAVNKNSDVLIGFAHAGASIHPSCAYALHMGTDTLGTWHPVYTYRHGQMAYYQTFGGGQDRWGDYSHTSVDPSNETDFWTLQESVPTYTGAITNSKWDTWWAHVQVCTPLTAPTAGVATAAPCPGTVNWYSVNAVSGAISYTWTVTGTGWSGTSTTDSIQLTAGTGIATISVVANSNCTTSTAYTFTVTPAPLPGTPVVTLPVPLPCVGATSTTVTVTDSNTTSYSWAVTGTGWSGTSTTATFNPAVGTGTGTITVHGVNTCGNGPTTTVTINPTTGPPTPVIALSGTMPCSGATSANYTATSAGATSYTWTVLGTGWSGGSTTSAITVTLGTGVGTLIATATDICGTSTADTFTANTSPLPGASTITSPAIPCPGTVGVYTVVSTGATSYVWSVTGTGWSGTSTTSTISVTAGSVTGTIVVYGVNTCGNGPATTINVTPASLPTTPTISLTSAAPCVGSASATYTGASTGATSYGWTVLGTGWSGTSTTSTITPTVGTGSGIIICVGTNTCGNSAPDTLVQTLGTYPILPTVTPPATVPCTGVINYSATSTGATSYSWTINGTGWSGTSTSGSIAVTIGTGTGQVIVSGVNACGNGPADTINVPLNAFPALPVITLASPLPCGGSATTGTYNATSAGATSYNWTVLGTGWSGTSATGTDVVTFGTGTGTIICYGINGCGNGPSDTVYVTSSPLPGTPSLLLTTAVPCASSGTVQYVANSIGATSYTWTVFGSGWSGSSTTDTAVITVGTGTGMIVVSGTNACGNGTDDTVYLTPTTGVGPASPIMATTGVCEGGSATFITSSVPGATSYVWVVTGTGWSGSSTTTSITATVGSGPAIITVYGVGACGGGLSYTLDSVYPVNVPSAAFTIANHVIGLGVSDLVTYTGSGSSTATYSWSFGGGTASPGTGMGPNMVSWSTTGLKTITLSVTDSGCTSVIFSDTVLVVISTDINGISENANINIVPNPNRGSFDIFFGMAINQPVSIRINDVAGRTIYTSDFSKVSDGKISVEAGDLPNGVYTATVITEGNVINKKLIIQR